MPFSPPIDRFVERPDPMDGVRALAVALEGEDRGELGGYVAIVLQKLANMNELFLGERVRHGRMLRFSKISFCSVVVVFFVSLNSCRPTGTKFKWFFFVLRL